MTTQRRYLIVAPCRNEAKYMRRTMDSVCHQTVPPTKFIIVDDGSTDETPAILAEYAAKFPFVAIVTRGDRGVRSVGPGVIEAFYTGLDTANLADFDYLCKLDLDLELPLRYFETLIERMESNPRLGTCSGKPYYPSTSGQADSGPLISEKIGDEMSAGMTKFYRVSCFQQIGGFVREVMWDGIDCHTCRMKGWIAQSIDDSAIRFIHLRPMGTSHQGIWTGRLRWGYGQYFMGTGLAYMTASAVYRMTRPPYFIGGFAMWCGYLRSMLARKPRYENPEFRAFLRAFQWNGLLKGKSAATRALDESGATRWSPP